MNPFTPDRWRCPYCRDQAVFGKFEIAVYFILMWIGGMLIGAGLIASLG